MCSLIACDILYLYIIKMINQLTFDCIIRNKKKVGFKFILFCFLFLVMFAWEAGFKLEKQPSLSEKRPK